MQSIGGGGGNGGANITGMVAYGVNPVIVGVGGSGGSGAKAGSVTVKEIRQLMLAASAQLGRSSAIAASSIGGGGGNAGINIAAAGNGLRKAEMQATIAVGGNGGTGSDGDKVMLIIMETS